MDPIDLLKCTASGMFPLAFIFLFGACLAKNGKFSINIVNGISKAYSHFLNPAFTFLNIVGSISLEKLKTLWPLFLTPSLMVLLGVSLSYFHSKIFKQVPFLSGVTTCVITFSNIGNLSIVLMRGVCSPYGPLSGNKYCSEANSYISLQVLTYAVMVWSVGYSLVEKDKEAHSRSVNSSGFEESIELKDFYHKNLGLSEVFKEKALEEKKFEVVGKTSIWKLILKNLLLPTPVACFLGLVVGLIPEVHRVFFDRNSRIYALVDAALGITTGGVVISQISLGANLVLLKSNNKDFTKRFIMSVVLVKNVMMPVVSFGIVFALWKIGLFGDNTVMAYIVYVCFCCPTALVVMVLTQTQGYGNEETAWLMLWIYIMSFPTLIISTYCFMLVIT